MAALENWLTSASPPVAGILLCNLIAAAKVHLFSAEAVTLLLRLLINRFKNTDLNVHGNFERSAESWPPSPLDLVEEQEMRICFADLVSCCLP